MTWYTSWFDSPYYELLYRQRDAAEARRFLQGLWPLLGLKPNARVWDSHSVNEFIVKVGFPLN